MSTTTELAQRMKAAAIRAKAATEDYVANRMSMSVCLSECEEFNNLSDGPNNIIALVEALEARDKQITELRAKDINVKRQAQALFDAIQNPDDAYIPAYVRCLRNALAGVAVEGE